MLSSVWQQKCRIYHKLPQLCNTASSSWAPNRAKINQTKEKLQQFQILNEIKWTVWNSGDIITIVKWRLHVIYVLSKINDHSSERKKNSIVKDWFPLITSSHKNFTPTFDQLELEVFVNNNNINIFLLFCFVFLQYIRDFSSEKLKNE